MCANSTGADHYKAYDESFQNRLRTTNVLERLNLEFKRRTKKIGAFPSEQSLLDS